MTSQENLPRWRLILGAEAEIDTLNNTNAAMDKALSALYDSEQRAGGLGNSSPKVARWLGDIRTYFPTAVVKVMQQDALQRLNLRQMLLEPEMLKALEPDVHLVANLLSLSSVIPN